MNQEIFHSRFITTEAMIFFAHKIRVKALQGRQYALLPASGRTCNSELSPLGWQLMVRHKAAKHRRSGDTEEPIKCSQLSWNHWTFTVKFSRRWRVQNNKLRIKRAVYLHSPSVCTMCEWLSPLLSEPMISWYNNHSFATWEIILFPTQLKISFAARNLFG